MKRLFAILAVSAMALMATSCITILGYLLTDDEDSSSSSTELANTNWRLNSPGDSVYHQDVIYTVSIRGSKDITFIRNIAGVDTVMTGTYTYSSGSGKCTMHYTTGDDRSDYNFRFSVSGNKMDFTFNLRTITLTRVK